MTEPASSLNRLAAACADALPQAPHSFEEDRHRFARELEALVAAVQDSAARFASDSRGRPAAVAAVRGALPALEADLLDAVLDDVACELAAWQEALYRLAHASRSRR